MACTRLNSLLLALLVQRCAAAIVSAPSATITAAPLVRRAVTTIGYISTDEYDGTTLWDAVTANEQGNAIAVSESLFQICDPTEPCTFYSCSRNYLILPTTSRFCGGSSLTCSYWELATDINDQNPLTNYWCDDITQEGGIIYKTTPTDVLTSVTITSKTSDKPVTPNTTISFSSTTTLPPIPIPINDDDSSPPVGAIAGGVVGGVAGLAAILFCIWFCLRQRKHNQTNTTTDNNAVPNTQQAPPPAAPTQQYPQQPLTGAQYYQGQNPVPQQQAQPMPPQPFYDPSTQSAYAQHAQNGHGMPGPEKTPAVAAMGQQTNAYYADSGPTSPVPQYSPNPPPVVPANVNELPSGRM